MLWALRSHRWLVAAVPERRHRRRPPPPPPRTPAGQQRPGRRFSLKRERPGRLICRGFSYLLLENGGAFYCFSASGTNAVSPRLKGAAAGGLVYFWSVSPMVRGGGRVLYLTAEPTHSHAVLPVTVLTVARHCPPDAQPQLGHILPQPLSGLAYKVYE